MKHRIFNRMLKKRFLSVLLAGALIVMSFGLTVPLSAKADAAEPAFGVISDVHLNASATLQQEDINLTNALTKFKASNIKVLMVAGDIADTGQSAAYEKFNQIFDSVFTNPSTAPQKVLVMGNHDYANGMTEEDAQDNFTDTLGCSLNTNITVNGYHFIGISTEGGDTNGVFTTSSTDWLTDQLDEAVAENPNLPIFVTFHQPVLDTVYCSDEWGNPTLDSVLSNYPQVITFSGHSHAVLEDERSIYQDFYTSVNVSSLTYTELESGKANGTIPPRANEVAQGIIGTISSTAVDLQRYDFHNDCVIKNDWIINLPCTRSGFTYTSDRSNTSVAPYFDTGSQITASNIANTSCVVNFTQAKDADFVQSYRIQVQSNQGMIQDFLIFSDFYLGLQRMAPTFSYGISGLSAGTTYTISVYGIESFGKQSPAITTTVTTLSSMPLTDILNVNFTDGTARDTSAYNTSFALKNNAQIIYDSTLNKNVLALDGNSYTNYFINKAQLSTITNHFTLEAVFKMDTIRNQAIVENCQSSGIGFESTSTGLVELWAYINGSYKRLGVQLQAGTYNYLVATYNGSTISLYLNGQLVKTKRVSGTVDYSSKVAMCFGGDPDPKGKAALNLDGNIALVRVMNEAISAADVLNHYNVFYS